MGFRSGIADRQFGFRPIQTAVNVGLSSLRVRHYPTDNLRTNVEALRSWHEHSHATSLPAVEGSRCRRANEHLGVEGLWPD